MMMINVLNLFYGLGIVLSTLDVLTHLLLIITL